MINKFFAIHRYFKYFRKVLNYAIPFYIRLLGVSVAEKTHFFGLPIVFIHKDSFISIDKRCILCSQSDMTDLGVNHPVVLRTLRAGASIEIGCDTGISGGSICAAISVVIGKECLIGANVTISDTDFHPISSVSRRYNTNAVDIDSKPVTIGNNVFIGTGSIILKGVHIGDNSVIGAGSVVTRNIPENSIFAGNPAIFIKNVRVMYA